MTTDPSTAPPELPPGTLSRLARENRLDAVRLLLEQGADPNERFEGGHTPLITSAGRGNLEMVELLLEFGARVNDMNNFGYTALVSAANQNRVDVVKTLIAHGANLDDVETSCGQTAVMLAVLNDRMELLQVLVEAGANLDKKNGLGNDAISLAQNGNKWEMVDYLKKAPAIQARVAKEKAEAERAKAMHAAVNTRQKNLRRTVRPGLRLS